MRNGYGYSELFSVFARANRGWLRRGWSERRPDKGRREVRGQRPAEGLISRGEGVIQAGIIV